MITIDGLKKSSKTWKPENCSWRLRKPWMLLNTVLPWMRLNTKWCLDAVKPLAAFFAFLQVTNVSTKNVISLWFGGNKVL